MGLPCNTHTFMSYPVHKRGASNPFGNEGTNCVVQGNELAYRSALLICLALVRHLIWMIENPGNSRCGYLPIVDYLMSLKNLLGSSRTTWSGPQLFFPLIKNLVCYACHHACSFNIFIYIYGFYCRWMGAYGAWSPKRELGYGNLHLPQQLISIQCLFILNSTI